MFKKITCWFLLNYIFLHAHGMIKLPNERKPSLYYTDECNCAENSPFKVVLCGANDFGLYPFPYDCKKYIECVEGQTFIRNCNHGYSFNKQEKKCNSENNINCQLQMTVTGYCENNMRTTEMTTENPSRSNDFYQEHAKDCAKYYDCTNRVCNVRQCPENSLFNTDINFCDKASKVDCGTRSRKSHPSITPAYNTEKICKRNSHSIRAYPAHSCWKYIQCKNNLLYIENCSPGLGFNNVLNECLPDDYCALKRAETDPHSYEPSVNKIVDFYREHSQDCGKYYDCTNRVCTLRQCPENSAFNTVTYLCDKASKVNCESRSRESLTAPGYDVDELCNRNSASIRAHHRDCWKYIRCVQGKSFIENCWPGESFDSRLKKCMPDKICGSLLRKRIERYYVYETGITVPGAINSINFTEDRTQEPPVWVYTGYSADRYVEHSQDCRKYYDCVNTVCTAQNCPENSAFNTDTFSCEKATNVDCGSRIRKSVILKSEKHTAEESCNDRSPKIREHPRACWKYIRCVQDITYIENCPPGQGFDNARNVCVPDNNCAYWLSENTESYYDYQVSGNHTNNFYQEHSQDCAKYYDCTNRVCTIRKCPENSAFNTVTNSCDKVSKVNCGTRSRKSLPNGTTVYDKKETCNFNSPAIRAHPNACWKYIRCVKDESFIENCWPGQSFNSTFEKCMLDKSCESVLRKSNERYYVYEINITVPGKITAHRNKELPEWAYTGYSTHRYVQHSQDCTKYYDCVNRVCTARQCPENSAFNTVTNICDKASKVDCGTRSRESIIFKSENLSTEISLFNNEESCNGSSVYTREHPQACWKYIRCEQGISYIENCHPGQSFDRIRKECVPDDDCAVLLIENTQSYYVNQISENKINHFYQENLQDCSKYYDCTNQVCTIRQCPEDSAFNTVTNFCDKASKVNCGTRSRRNFLNGATAYDKEESCNLNSPAIRAHPSACEKYIRCVKDKSFIDNCWPGQSFNDRLQKCMPDKNCTFVLHKKKESYYVYEINIIVPGTDNRNNITVDPNQEIQEWLYKGYYTDRYVEHSQDCAKYYDCANQVCIARNCPENSAFNTEKSLCENANNVDCGSRSRKSIILKSENLTGGISIYNTEESCNVNSPYIRKHPHVCWKYIRCDQDISYIENCPPGHGFDNTHNNCVPDDKCANLLRENTQSYYVNQISESQTNSFYQEHSEDCAKYYDCSNRICTLRQCPENSAFNTVFKVCDMANKVNCRARSRISITSETPEYDDEEYCNDNSPTIRAHPSACGKYIRCVQDKSFIDNCWPGESFNKRLQKCVPDKNCPFLLHENTERYYVYETKIIIPGTDYRSNVTDHPNQEIQEWIYKGYHTDRYVEHSQDCAKYYDCANQVCIARNCPENSAFNTAKYICENANNIDCGSRTRKSIILKSENRTSELSLYNTEELCIASSPYIREYPHVCWKYIRCEQGISYIENCNPGQGFDNTINECVPDDNCGFMLRENTESYYIQGISENQTTHFYKEHSQDCAKYYDCTNQLCTIRHCPENSAFNTVTNYCDIAKNVNCGSRSRKSLTNGTTVHDKDVSCNINSPSIRAHPRTCWKYIRCMSNQTFIENCRPGQSFNNILKRCMPDKNCTFLLYDNTESFYVYETSIIVTDHNPELPKWVYTGYSTERYVEHSQDCAQYYDCTNGVFTARYCPENSAFNTVTNVCDKASKVECGSRSKESIIIKAEKITTGISMYTTEESCNASSPYIREHPHACWKYIRCVQGISYIENCMPGQAFDNTFNYCMPDKRCLGLLIENTEEYLDSYLNHADQKKDTFYEDLKLESDSESDRMGSVQIKINGIWNYICDDKFDIQAGNVFCREIGFKLGAHQVLKNSYFVTAEILRKKKIVFSNFNEVLCRGNETSMKDCEFIGWETKGCKADEVAGVVCKLPPKNSCNYNAYMCGTKDQCVPRRKLCDGIADCSDASDETLPECSEETEYRILGRKHSIEGRLQMKYHGKWGTVCDDYFSNVEAQVFCNSMGYTGDAKFSRGNFGEGYGPIWSTEHSCTNTEDNHNLGSCNTGNNEYAPIDCQHYQDITIKCSIGRTKIH